MNFKDAVQVAAAVIAGLGGGGAIVFGLSGYLGKVWAERGLEKQRQDYAKLNIEFTHQLDIVSRRVQIELDTIGHLHKLRTASEFEKVRELWARIARVKQAFYSLPSEYSERVAEFDATKKLLVEGSKAFVDRCNEALELLTNDTLSIPKNIADAAVELLAIAGEERLHTTMWPNPFDKSPFALPMSEGLAGFFKRRSDNMRKFSEGTEQLESIMRQYLKGEN